MYRSSRSVTRTVSSSRLFHSSPLCLNTVQPQQAPPKPVEPSERKDSDQPDGQPPLPERLREAASLLRGYITRATGDTAINIRKRADGFTAVTQTLFSELGGQLNHATGYEEIELLKKKVGEQESRINAAREAAQIAKQTYEEAVITRSNSQREVNELLQRKHTWTDADVGKFTMLVREDHSYEQAEARAKEAAKAADGDVERELNELLRSILARYHEEQVWSDKIRSASTYGSMAALALNLLVFITATLIIEPWKRHRLAHTFEKKVEELSQETKDLLEREIHHLETRLDTVIAAIPPSHPTSPPPPPIEVETISVPSGPTTLPYRLYDDWCSIPHKVEGGLVVSALVLGWLLGRHH
ncbi:hypothetical protein BDM02DRAFT_3102769 [Thelephora ganbajun]|uniref:Uncharacterized protein n=1 Tax=Thelephora ganbajun TaxID=370292 RepID=A0ACB6Z581_THEGA|nr:hypothetical protein BDM02DRAFT_3102769 [Thelephora ganbajun]